MEFSAGCSRCLRVWRAFCLRQTWVVSSDSTISAILEADPDDTLHLPLPEELRHGLGFPGEEAIIQYVIATSKCYPLDDEVIERASRLRRIKRMGLADSVIAATALESGLPLVTRNVHDFQHIPGLIIINPFAARNLSKLSKNLAAGMCPPPARAYADSNCRSTYGRIPPCR